MDTQELTAARQTLGALRDRVGALAFSECDQDDLFELLERVETEISTSDPDTQVIGTFLNSIARSLRARPEAREICLRTEELLTRLGLPSTWQAGI